MALVKKIIFSVLLLTMAAWVVRYGWQQRLIESKNYDRVSGSAEAQFEAGVRALYENRHEDAGICFQNAVSEEVLFIDAWLKLAEVRMASGRIDEAVSILRFTDGLTTDVVKWKWPQILLARDLGACDVFLRNTNFVLSHCQLRDDALLLMDMHYRGKCEDVIEVLETENLAWYLQWLMKWKRSVSAGLPLAREKYFNGPAPVYGDFRIRLQRIECEKRDDCVIHGLEGRGAGVFDAGGLQFRCCPAQEKQEPAV